MSPPSTRITIKEYGRATSLSDLVRTAHVSHGDLLSLLADASSRVDEVLGIRDGLALNSDEFRARGIAGKLRLGRNIDLEIQPKFLESDDESWREDFLFVAMISRFGRILPREAFAATAIDRTDLADLIGRAMIQLFDGLYRRPLRVYKRRVWTGWELDGEADPESIALPDPEGFLQEGLRLDRDNQYNRAIALGMETIAPSVRSSDTRQGLGHRVRKLGPQTRHARLTRRSLPARHSRWQDLFDLCLAVTEDQRFAYGEGTSGVLPGFLVETASAWEALMLLGLRLGLPGKVVMKRSHPFGTYRMPAGDSWKIDATPDVTVGPVGQVEFVADAKYKVVDEVDIARPDVYEVVAFARAAHCQLGVLLYPGAPGRPALTGAVEHFATIEVDGVRVLACTVNVRGISDREGLWRFGRTIGASLTAIIASDGVGRS